MRSPLAYRRRLDSVLALSRQHPMWRLVHMLVLSWQHLDLAFGYALRIGHQRLGLSGGGFFSLASGFDAGGPLGQGWCSAHDQQHSPSFVRVNAREFDFPRVHIHDHPLTSPFTTLATRHRFLQYRFPHTP